MNRGTFAIAVLLMLIPLVHCARVSGSVWDAVKMEPAESFAVEINTTPLQRDITGPDGYYSFDVAPGDYTLEVLRVNNRSELEGVASQKISIQKEGNYTIDILAFYPDFSLPDLSVPDFEVPQYEGQENAEIVAGTVVPKAGSPPSMLMMALLIVALGIALILAVYLLKKARGKPENPQKRAFVPDESDAGQKKPPAKKLPSELRDIVRIMKRNGGRMTQKELREEIPLSEAKVSLMLTDLESRGVIRRIKQGRGNALILEEE